MKITGTVKWDEHGDQHPDLEIADFSTRDLFACFALAGLLLADETAKANIKQQDGIWQSATTHPEMAGAAYDLADAMLKARRQK